MYRPSKLMLLAGVALVLLGATITAWLVWSLRTHYRWWTTNSRYSRRTHLASDSEKVWNTIFFAPLLPIGALLIATWRNSRAIIDRDGIVVRNGLGKETLRAEWPSVTALLTRQRTKGGCVYILYAGRKQTILGSYTEFDSLVSEIRRHVPNLIEGDADSAERGLG